MGKEKTGLGVFIFKLLYPADKYVCLLHAMAMMELARNRKIESFCTEMLTSIVVASTVMLPVAGLV